MKTVKLACFITAFSLTASLVAPGVFATTEGTATNEISGNGAGSINTITNFSSSVDITEQQNSSGITTVANSVSSTGGNSVVGNTGGSSTLTSGSADSTTAVAVSGSINVADTANPCGCLPAPSNLITGNGPRSFNKISNTSCSTSLVSQTNLFGVTTVAGSLAKTGKNKIKYNTGGTSSLLTGPAASLTTVGVEAPQNLLNAGL